MSAIPDEVIQAWQAKPAPACLATVSEDGQPNVIYTTFVSYRGENRFIITDHFMEKTRQNIQAGSDGALLFMSPDGRGAYQLKGALEYQDSGELFDELKKTMPPTLPGNAIVLLDVSEVYCGAEKLL